MLTLNYHVEMPHWAEFVKLAQFRVIGWWGYVYGIFIGLSMVVIAKILAACEACDIDEHSALFGILAYFLVISAANFLWNNWFYRKSAKPAGATLGERKLIASIDSIEVIGPNIRNINKWRGIESISESKTVLTLWTDKTAGIIIPKSAFDSPKQQSEFMSFVEARVREAQTFS